MTRRWTLLALGAALWTCGGAGSISAAQHPQAGRGGAKHTAHGTHDKQMDRVLAGMTAAEKQKVREHLAKMSAADRKRMLDHMLAMTPAERRRMVQHMLPARKDGKAHGHGEGHGHGKDGHKDGHGKGGHSKDGKAHGHGEMHGHKDGHDKGGHSKDGHKEGHGAQDQDRSGGSHARPPRGHAEGGNPHRPAPLAIGDPVPDFEVRDLQGKSRRLSDLRKQTKSGVVSLTFWCSFCHSCRHMEAGLDQFARDHKNEAVVAAIDASAGETAAGVSAFAKRTSLSLPILMDSPGKAADLFGVQVTTTTVLIDGRGILRYRGQFREGDRMVASDALKAVLAGETVARKETPLRG